MKVAYEKGLHELGDGLYAYLQPDGGWGWSNAGLIDAGGTSLLVDTLYDHRLTREMLDAMAHVTERSPIDQAMNTHGNPDHCFGNDLLPSATEIYATKAAAEELALLSPAVLQGLKDADLGPEINAFVEHAFGPFDFEGIQLRPASTTFVGSLDVQVGDRPVRFLEVGPAHTEGDAIVHVPDAGVVFTGDILFVEGTPMVWAGPFSNWIRACDVILELGARVLVPGHGPVTDESGVRDVQRYLRHVHAEARKRFDAGMTVEEAADDIDVSDFDDWNDVERIAANVGTAYRELDPSLPEIPAAEQLMRMARWKARH